MTLDVRGAELAKLLDATPKLFPSETARFTDFALDALEAGRAELALAVLIPLSEKAPQNAVAWQLLGLAYRAEQQSGSAIQAMAKAASLAPANARIANGYAQATFEAGIPSAALFKQARALSPEDPELALSAAAALCAEGRGSVAETMLERLVVANPAWVRGHDALSRQRWVQSGKADFSRSFRAAVRSMPHDVGLWLAWLRAESQLAHWDVSRTIISESRSIFGAMPEFDAAEAYVSTESGDDEAAERLFTLAARVDDPGVRISHIRHCLRTGRVDQAETIALNLTHGPAAATAWPYLSLIWRLKGDSRAAWLDGDPAFLAHYDLPLDFAELQALAEHLRRLHLSCHHPAEQSLRGGTQTEGALFLRTDPELAAIRAHILEAVRAYVDALPPEDDTHPLLGPGRSKLLFAGSWSVRLTAQGFHVHHTHPLGWISSACYVSLPATDQMGAEPAGWIELGAPPPDLRIELPAYARAEPKPGRLVLFPSTMWHGTIPFADGERLTIAFDMAVPRR